MDVRRLRSPPPRAALLALAGAVALEGTAAFVLYAILWSFVATVAAVLAAVAYAEHTPSDHRVVAVALLLAAGTFGVAWALFGWFVARRTREARRLFCDGGLHDGVVTSSTVEKSARVIASRVTVTFTLNEQTYLASTGFWGASSPAVGAPASVLVVAGMPRCALFLPEGRMSEGRFEPLESARS